MYLVDCYSIFAFIHNCSEAENFHQSVCNEELINGFQLLDIVSLESAVIINSLSKID